MGENSLRPISHIKASKTGKAHISAVIRNELGNRLDLFLDANVALMVRPDITPDDILYGLDILKAHLISKMRRGKKKVD